MDEQCLNVLQLRFGHFAHGLFLLTARAATRCHAAKSRSAGRRHPLWMTVKTRYVKGPEAAGEEDAPSSLGRAVS